MAKPPSGYSIQRGAYFTADGQGPYAWDGTSMTLIGNGVGGSSTSVSGGSDWKLVTEEAYGGGVRVDTYTDDSGLIWDRNYNPDGSLNTETALGGALIRTWSYTAGGLGYISSGAVRKSGGAYRVATADMASIKTELTALGANCDAPAFWVHDFDNGLANGGLDVVWDKARACFRGPNRAPMLADEWYGTVNVPNTYPSESGDLVTLTFPGWMAGPRTRFEVEAFTNDNSSGGCAMNFYMGGTIMYVVSDASAGRRTAEFMGRWWNNDSLTSQLTINPTAGQNPTSLTGGGGAGPNAFAATSINTGAASVDVVLRITPTTADPAAVLRRAVLTLRN